LRPGPIEHRAGAGAKQAAARRAQLAAAVQQDGSASTKSTNAFLMVIGFVSADNSK